jgi:hypothetical protein
MVLKKWDRRKWNAFIWLRLGKKVVGSGNENSGSLNAEFSTS